MQGLSKKHDISSEDNEIVKAGKEHLIKCLEARTLLALDNEHQHASSLTALLHSHNTVAQLT